MWVKLKKGSFLEKKQVGPSEQQCSKERKRKNIMV
jgi:hypothetical protein